MAIKAGHFGTRLSTGQLCAAALPSWYQQGASLDEIATIVAIAGAESDGFCQAVSEVASDGTQGFGCCQIESSHTELGTFDETNSNHWQNPIVNFQMARQVFAKAGGNFDPWSTFTNGRYVMYKTQATTVLTGLLTVNDQGSPDLTTQRIVPNLLGTVPEANLGHDTINTILHYLNINTYDSSKIKVPNPVSALQSFYDAVSKFLGKATKVGNWASVGYILAGLVLVFVSLARLGHLGSKAAKLAPLAAL
jgi:hypothetical protein